MVPKKVLIVEDEEKIIELILEIFEGISNFQTMCARDGEDACKIAESYVPDIILLDIFLPLLDGYEVCKFVKSQPALSQTKVLIISGTGQNYDLLKAREAGADGYIIKPFTSTMLIEKVEVLLKFSSRVSEWKIGNW
jgi:DNA-binding response OmpR family regulator